jgi:prepilin-type N-terminal cleavage/methylation domain-containing protein
MRTLLALKDKRRSQAGVSLIELLVSMIIMAVVTTMLVGTWLQLNRTAEFARADNTAGATGRDALDRVSAEIRDAQPLTTASTTPFIFTMTTPFVNDANDCVFYSAYNNALTSSQSGTDGKAQLLPTAIWLDTSGTSPQKKLYWQRDTNKNGVLDSGDRITLLANNVVNSTISPTKPIFTYVFYNKTTGFSSSTTLSNTVGSANYVGSLVTVNIELVVDANLTHKPTYVDIVSTVRPRNVVTN